MDDCAPLTSASPSNTHLACLPSHTHSDKCWANQGDICITHRHLMSACLHTKTRECSVRCQTPFINTLEAKFPSEKVAEFMIKKNKKLCYVGSVTFVVYRRSFPQSQPLQSNRLIAKPLKCKGVAAPRLQKGGEEGSPVLVVSSLK